MRNKAVWALGLIFVLAATACSAGSAPAVAPSAKTGATVSAPTVEDVAWAKVVEAAQKEGRVVIYSISMTGDVGTALTAAFKQRYGVSLDVISSRGAEMVQRLTTESRTGQKEGDIMESSPTYNILLKNAGLSVGLLDLPALRDKQVFAVDPLINDSEGHVLGYTYKGLWPIINTNLVKPGEEIKSYKDMLLPKWKGKLMLVDPNISTCTYNVLNSLIDRKLMDDSFPLALGQQEPKFAVGTRDIADAVVKGEVPLGFCAIENDMAPFLSQGAPLKPLVMEEGNVFYTTAVTAVKDSPHPNATKVFLNWLLTQEGQTVYDRATQVPSVRKDVQDFRSSILQAKPKLMVVMNGADNARDSKQFADKTLVKLWKK